MKKFLIILITMLLSSAVYAEEELSKQATAFYSDNNYNKTLDLLLQINENERTAQDWLLLGNLYNEKSEKENAIYMYQKSILTDKKFYKAYYNLANVYFEQRKYDLAIKNYKKASGYNKKNPYIFYNLGCIYIKQNDFQKAKKYNLTALTIKNDIPEFQYNMAYIYKNLDKPKLAQIYLDNYNKLTESSEP